MRKRRKFADGGVTGGQVQQPTYPFYGNQPQAGGQSGGMNQTFNMQPQAISGPNDQMTQGFAKGGQAKVGKVMTEFKAGKLKSSSGQKVTNPKQAIAIGLSEAGLSKKAKGGEMKESKAMVKKEVSFMKKKGAPKSMIKHEMKEAGMKKMAMGGAALGALSRAAQQTKASLPKSPMTSKPPSGTGVRSTVPAAAPKPNPQQIQSRSNALRGVAMNPPGAAMRKKAGGLAAGHKQADGVAKKGKTRAMQVKMAGGGKTKKYC